MSRHLSLPTRPRSPGPPLGFLEQVGLNCLLQQEGDCAYQGTDGVGKIVWSGLDAVRKWAVLCFSILIHLTRREGRLKWGQSWSGQRSNTHSLAGRGGTFGVLWCGQGLCFVCVHLILHLVLFLFESILLVEWPCLLFVCNLRALVCLPGQLQLSELPFSFSQPMLTVVTLSSS